MRDRKTLNEVKHKIEALESFRKEERTVSIEETITELKNIENGYTSSKIRGSLLRSKVPGVEEGDMNLAYYSKLEKTRADQNTIFALMNKKGELVEGNDKVSEVIYDFYSNLYSRELEDETIQDEFLSGITTKLSEEERLKLEADFTEEELRSSMVDLKRN